MKSWRIWLVCAMILVAGALIYFRRSSLNSIQPYEGTELTGEAPNFQLTDQHGSVIKLSDFRGKVIVLTFMDSKCKDTCPLTAAQLRLAYQQLDQNEASQVAFIGVNVNVKANGIADVYEISKTWHLDEVPIWYFLTGNRDDLEHVWQEYHIAVEPSPDSQNEEILHTPGIYIIDPSGQERWYISTPFSAEGNAEWILPLSDLLVSHIHEILGENKH